MHLILPFIVLLTIILCLELTSFDFWLAQHFYDVDLKQWTYREHWLTAKVMHSAGRYGAYILGIIILIITLLSYRKKNKFHYYRYALTFLIVASLTGPLIITILKGKTHIYCPWDLIVFGGTKPHIGLFDSFPSNLPTGHCFPAGHSGIGYTFLSFYFFLMVIKPQYKYYGLLLGFTMGLSYGIAQQIRGAHFLSHDILALTIDWFSIVIVFLLFFHRNIQWK